MRITLWKNLTREIALLPPSVQEYACLVEISVEILNRKVSQTFSVDNK